MTRIIVKGVSPVFETNSAIWHENVLNRKHTGITPAIPLHIDFTNFAVTFNWIKTHNIDWMINQKELQTALKEKHYWLNIKHKERIIGYLKIGFGSVYINDFRQIIHFSKDTAFIYDTFVMPEFRNKKVAAYFINEACDFLKTKGFKRVLCHIPQWNRSSMKAYGSAGFKKKKFVRWIKFFGFKKFTYNLANL
ncbi:MAG: GNAT family N-acetyltransferase [Desulfobacteraceae bacterium]|nr:GNAT family N-acetyltransferase [Desulfobacteraceae bacterium]